MSWKHSGSFKFMSLYSFCSPTTFTSVFITRVQMAGCFFLKGSQVHKSCRLHTLSILCGNVRSCRWPAVNLLWPLFVVPAAQRRSARQHLFAQSVRVWSKRVRRVSSFMALKLTRAPLYAAPIKSDFIGHVDGEENQWVSLISAAPGREKDSWKPTLRWASVSTLAFFCCNMKIL